MAPRSRSLGLLASVLCWGAVESCGVLIHNEVLHRSTHLFSLPNSTPDLAPLTSLISPLLTAPHHAPSLQAGAFFPDWGYQCLSTDDSAEAAHWPPFLVASVEHIISTYGYLNDTLSRSAPEQDHLESLIAFIFAIAGHQTADATWHAIRLPSGLLAALAGVDFDGDVSRAHRVLDFGGDFVLAARLARMESWSWGWIEDEWRVPVKDLIAIYKRLGRDVNTFVLRYCTMRGLAALRSGLTVGPSLHDSFAAQSPSLLTTLDPYHLGGISEMSARTVSCWSNLTRWFAHGIPKSEKLLNGWSICDVFRAIHARGGAGESTNHRGPSPEPILQQSKLEFARIKVHTDAFGAETYTLPPADTPAAPFSRQQHTAAPRLKEPTYIATYVPYSHFGTSLTLGTFSAGGAPALAISAPLETEDSARPNEGNVYILPLSDLLGGEPSDADAQQPTYISKNTITQLTHSASSTDQRFGASTATLHALNTTLLAVAAPGPYSYDGESPPSLPFRGTVAAGRIDFFRGGEAARWISVVVTGGAEMGGIGRRWWGDEMTVAEFDGMGEVLVVSGSSGDGQRLCEGAERAQMGEGEVGIFQLVSGGTGEAADGQMVELTLGDKGVSAAAAGLTINTWNIPLPPPQKADVPCDVTDTYEYFGRSLSFSPASQTLLVGAPGVGAGKVFGYVFRDGEFTLSFTISSSTSGVRTGFGGGGLAAGVTRGGREWIAVGAGDEEVDGEAQAGVVRVFVLDTDAVTGLIDARLVAEVVAQADTGRRRFGKFGRTIVRDESQGMWVGSEFWDGERGAVWWIDVEALVDGVGKRGQQVLMKGEGGRVEVPVERVGEEPNAHFATSLAVGPGGELFVGIPYSGVAREEQELRFYGAVAVFVKT